MFVLFLSQSLDLKSGPQGEENRYDTGFSKKASNSLVSCVTLYLLDLRAGCGIRSEIINTAILLIHQGNVPEPSCKVVG